MTGLFLPLQNPIELVDIKPDFGYLKSIRKSILPTYPETWLTLTSFQMHKVFQFDSQVVDFMNTELKNTKLYRKFFPMKVSGILAIPI